jgi:hypothetical protein
MEHWAIRNEFNQSPIRACHNCRRSRRRCDRSIPTCLKCHSMGQVCLGYGMLLQWTNSVASRGKMMGKSFAMTNTSETQTIAPCFSSRTPPMAWKAESPPNSVSSWCRQLGDPLFADLSKSSKFYLAYCKLQ